eukprot:2721463-Alexandrium_andersonii.AAC.1
MRGASAATPALSAYPRRRGRRAATPLGHVARAGRTGSVVQEPAARRGGVVRNSEVAPRRPARTRRT